MKKISETRIVELIKDVSLKHEIPPIDKSTNLFTSLILDSLAIINLIIVLEEEYSFTFDYSDFKPETFSSVENIEKLLRKVCPHLTS